MDNFNPDHYRFRRTGNLGRSDYCLRKHRRKQKRLGIFFLILMIILGIGAYFCLLPSLISWLTLAVMIVSYAV